MRWTLLNKIFDHNQISDLQKLIDLKATSVDEISDTLIKFGYRTQNIREEAFLSVYSHLLKGMYIHLYYHCFIVVYILRIIFQ